MTKIPDKWDLETDVLVMGSGASGLVAAIIAHDEGANVTLIEKAAVIGGATAVSGGFPWIPNNHLEKEMGIADSREEALTYMKFIADGQVDDELVEAIRVYIEKFPYVSAYLKLMMTPFPKVMGILEKAISKLPGAPDFNTPFPAKFYKVIPHKVYWIDNEKSFGKRQEIIL